MLWLAVGAVVLGVLLVLRYVPRVQDAFFGKLLWPLVSHKVDKGFSECKKTLFDRAGLKGRILEVGAGDGVNLPYFLAYPAITSLVLLEPNPYLYAQLQKKVDKINKDAPALSIALFRGTLADYHAAHRRERFDFVVSTLVLCSVPSQPESLRQVLDLLRAGGGFVFLEHVIAAAGARRHIQTLLHPLFCSVAGCHTTRDTAARIFAEAFAQVDIERFDHADAPWPMRPHIRGIALAP